MIIETAIKSESTCELFKSLGALEALTESSIISYSTSREAPFGTLEHALHDLLASEAGSWNDLDEILSQHHAYLHTQAFSIGKFGSATLLRRSLSRTSATTDNEKYQVWCIKLNEIAKAQISRCMSLIESDEARIDIQEDDIVREVVAAIALGLNESIRRIPTNISLDVEEEDDRFRRDRSSAQSPFIGGHAKEEVIEQVESESRQSNHSESLNPKSSSRPHIRRHTFSLVIEVSPKKHRSFTPQSLHKKREIVRKSLHTPTPSPSPPSLPSPPFPTLPDIPVTPIRQVNLATPVVMPIIPAALPFIPRQPPVLGTNRGSVLFPENNSIPPILSPSILAAFGEEGFTRQGPYGSDIGGGNAQTVTAEHLCLGKFDDYSVPGQSTILFSSDANLKSLQNKPSRNLFKTFGENDWRYAGTYSASPIQHITWFDIQNMSLQDQEKIKAVVMIRVVAKSSRLHDWGFISRPEKTKKDKLDSKTKTEPLQFADFEHQWENNQNIVLNYVHLTCIGSDLAALQRWQNKRAIRLPH